MEPFEVLVWSREDKATPIIIDIDSPVFAISHEEVHDEVCAQLGKKDLNPKDYFIYIRPFLTI